MMSLTKTASNLLYGKNAFRYYFVPVSFLLVFTVGIQVLMTWSQDESFSLQRLIDDMRGDCTSWTITLAFYCWAWLSIVLSTKTHLGAETTFGVKPRYADNGFSYFIATMTAFLVIQAVYPDTSRLLYEKFPKVIGASNSFALLFCAWLFVKGKLWKEHAGDVAEAAPAAYEYYRGMELHPRILTADVKQWTNCRVGMMAWPIFLTAFFIHSLYTTGFHAAHFMHVLLQMVYIAKFYWWEAGYFHTIDMMVDRAGYYLCWGCLVFLPAYFCFPAALVITNPSTLSDFIALTRVSPCEGQHTMTVRGKMGARRVNSSPAAASVLYSENALRYHIVPPVFLLFFTSIVQFLSVIGRGERFDCDVAVANLKGNATAWKWLLGVCLWAFYSLKIPSKTVLGPETPFGYQPVYKDNGFAYYLVTLVSYLVAHLIWPDLSASLYDNFPQLLGCFNIVALTLCSYLWIKGRYHPEFKQDREPRRPVLYEFYRGLELHPRLLGVDVKQWTNCRIGLMCWQIFVTSFYIVSYQRNGFNLAFTVDLLLQTVYIGKFFWWEAGYFFTLDMMLDRAGYYLCWGCLVWVTGFYTYCSYYQVANPNLLSCTAASSILAIGLLAIFLNYRVDYEKQVFRKSAHYKCNLWGRPATFVSAEYTDHTGKTRKSALLTSGFWGKGRHINYTFELLAAWSWCAAGGLGNSLLPFAYFFFLLGLLIHRTIRDEDKCSKKYGKHWDLYCKQVPYRLLPYIW